jgi:hypothetical protein
MKLHERLVSMLFPKRGVSEIRRIFEWAIFVFNNIGHRCFDEDVVFFGFDPVRGMGYRDTKPSSDQWLGYLKRFEKLETLDLRLPSLTDQGMRLVEALKSVRRTEVSCRNISETAFSAFGKLDRLEVLHLRECYHFTDWSFSQLPLEGLTELCLWDADISDGVGDHFDRLCSLKVLELGGSQRVTNNISARISLMPNLETLSLYGCVHFSDWGLPELSNAAKLRSLILRGNITDLGLDALLQISTLEELEIQYSRVTLAGVLKFLSAATSLKKFAFWTQTTPPLSSSEFYEIQCECRKRNITLEAGGPLLFYKQDVSYWIRYYYGPRFTVLDRDKCWYYDGGGSPVIVR